jgi:hypothetical protein
MAVLSVALEEGFEGDAVVVEVNGRKVFERDGVRTRMQVGLAERFEVPVDQGEAVVEVQVVSRGAAGRIVRPIADQLHVGVSLERGDVVFRVSEEPFGYV